MNTEILNVGVVQFVNAPYKDETYRYLQEHYPVKLVIGTFSFEDNHPEWKYENRDANRSDSVRDFLKKNRKCFDALVVSGYNEKVSRYAILFAKTHRIPLIMAADTVESFGHELIKKLIYRMTDAFWVPGDRSKNFFLSRNIDNDKIYTGGYTYDYLKIRERVMSIDRSTMRKRLGILEDCFVYLFVGKLIPGRKVKELIDAFMMMESSRIKLIIIGNGEQKNIVDEATECDKRIVSVSEVDLEHLYDYYAIADAYVHPGKEPYSCAVMQAAAAALPVIATREVGAIDDFMRDGENGMIVPYGNADELHKAMENVLINFEQFRAGAKTVQSYVCDKLGTDHASGQLYDAIRYAVKR